MKQKFLFNLALALSLSLSLVFVQLPGRAYAQEPALGLPEVAWDVTYDGGTPDDTRSITTDIDGNVYVTGNSGEEGARDFRTIKYDRDGAVVWNVIYGESGATEYVSKVAVDSAGNVYVSGTSTANGSDHMVLVKYNSLGVVQWTASYESGAWEQVIGALPDGSGNVYVAGVRYTGDVDSDRYLLKYDSSGALLWAVADAYPGRDSNGDLALDPAGNLYITGFLDDMYRTTEYDGNGAVLWNHVYNPGTWDYSYGIALDNAGNVYVTGHSGNNYTYLEAVVLKYDPAGNLLWDRRYDGGQFARPAGIAVDGSGGIYLAVSRSDSAAGPAISMDVVKYNSAGNLVWELPYDMAAGARSGGVAVDASGRNIYLTGYSSNGTNDDFRTLKYSSEFTEFFDDFESYPIGSKLPGIYEYQGIAGWNSSAPAPEADRFQMGSVGSNKTFQYQWAGPSYHHPHVREFYMPKFSRVYEAGATYLHTQPSMGIEMFMFEWDPEEAANSIFLMASYANTLAVYRNGTPQPLAQLTLWPDTVITQMSHRIEVKRLSDTSLEASVIRLDTNEKLSTTVTIPYLESAAGFNTGFGFYEDWGGGVYVNMDDFYVKGVPLSTAASLSATSASTDIYPGDPVVVELNIGNANGLYGAQAICETDANVIRPRQAVFGDFFDPVNRLIGANNPDAASGSWTGAISQRSPALPLSGNGLFATVTYEARAAGTASIDCETLFADQNGFPQDVSFSGLDVTVLPFALVDGTARAQGRVDHSGITVTAAGPVMTIALVDDSGNYVLHLRTGSYEIEAHAAGYLTRHVATITVTSGDTLTLPEIILSGGDANGDNTIDIGDATLVAANFGLPVPPADGRADINGDAFVNVQDLALVGSNYGRSGD